MTVIPLAELMGTGDDQRLLLEVDELIADCLKYGEVDLGDVLAMLVTITAKTVAALPQDQRQHSLNYVLRQLPEAVAFMAQEP